jgi:asparaginyl-tRNA synthetase
MAYIINRFSGQQLVVLEDGTLNTTTSVGLVGRNYTGYGEIQNENFLFLLENFAKHGLDPEAYDWYIDLRRYGSVPHAGFGLGFERLLMFVTGMANIRDVIPFARTPGHCEF